MFKFPDSSLFSKIHPSGISIRCPSLATTVVLINNRMSKTKQRNKTKLTDDCSAKGHIPTKVYITSHRQMIKFQNLGNLLEPLLELLDLQKNINISITPILKKKEKRLRYLLEMISQFNNRCSLKHPLLVNNKLTMLQRIYITLDQQQVTATLDWQESFTRDVDAMSVFEMLNSGSGGGFELDDRVTLIGCFGINDNFQFHTIVGHYLFESYRK